MKLTHYVVFISLLTMATSLWAEAFTPEQEARIREIVRETMVNEPKVLEEAIISFQNYQSQQQTKQLVDVIKQNSEKLYNDPSSPRMGAKKPLVTLVVFTDYNCPYCKQFDPVLERIVKENPEIALIVKFLPFKGATSVKSAAEATVIWEQAPDKFWALNELLFKFKGMHTEQSITKAKEKVGLAKINSGEKQMDTLRANFALASALSVQGTPFLLVGDMPVSGAVSYEELNKIVKQQIKQAK